MKSKHQNRAMIELTKYSQELRYLIEKPQSSFTKFVYFFLIGLSIVIIILSVTISSPDIALADVRITSRRPPIILKAQTQGRLLLIKKSIPDSVKEGEWIAVLSNPAVLEDMKYLFSCIPDEPMGDILHEEKIAGLETGIISAQLSNYLMARFQYKILTAKENEHQTNIKNLEARLEYDRKEFQFLKEDLEYSEQQHALKKKQFETDSCLFLSNAILEKEYESSLLQLLSSSQNITDVKKKILLKERSIMENEFSIMEENRNYAQSIESYYATVEKTFIELRSQMSSWKETFVFSAPENATIEWAGAINDGDFLLSGTPVFSLNRDDTKYEAVAILPSTNAGKVKSGQKVRIKIEAFPYAEYGYIEGVVNSVSLNTVERNYLVEIALPSGVMSSTGKELTFAHSLYGTAEIITEKRRLITKIFNRTYEILTTRGGHSENSQDSQYNM